MKSILLPCTVAAFAGLALCAPLAAQAQTAAPATATTATTATATPAGKPATAKKTEYQGDLKAIDAGGASVTVQSKSASLTLAINAETKILVDKKPAKLTDFAVGDKVTGSYTKDDAGATTAASLHKKTTAPKAK